MDDSEEPFDWRCPNLEPCDVERQREIDNVTKSHEEKYK